MRGDAFSRQLRLLQLLESRPQGIEIDEAAEELGKGRRTVYRDFEVLERSGIPLIAERDGRKARWRMMPGYRHRLQLSLTWSEVLALSTGSQLMAGLAGTLFHEGAVSALEKIRATLPKPLADRARHAEAVVSTSRGGHDYATRRRILDVLLEAIHQRRSVLARYRSRTGRRRSPSALRRIDPYHLRVTEQAIYLIGYCHEAKAPRTFLLDRFESVEETTDTFHVDPGFRADAFLGGSFGMWTGIPRRVRFVVAPPLAHLFFERKLHPSQIAQRRSDGAAEVQLHVAIGPPLVAYLAGLGASVSQISPGSLRRDVLRVHEEALQLTRRRSVGALVGSDRSARPAALASQ
ncbi:MAG: WYL domain-containing protein [Myxococcaceae bacterium]|nr:WYL domain-containing protein [Myxococcaceae bacterium]